MPTNADITDPLKVNTEEMLSMFSLLIFESLISINESGKLVAELAEKLERGRDRYGMDRQPPEWTLLVRWNAILPPAT